MPTIPLASRQTHPGVVARVELLSHGGDVLHQELVPLPLEGDLVHVDVNGGHVFIAALDAVVLEGSVGRESKMAPRLPHSDTQALDSPLPLDLVQDATLCVCVGSCRCP